MQKELTVINTNKLLNYNQAYSAFTRSTPYHHAKIVMQSKGIGKELIEHTLQAIFIYAYTTKKS